MLVHPPIHSKPSFFYNDSQFKIIVTSYLEQKTTTFTTKLFLTIAWPCQDLRFDCKNG